MIKHALKPLRNRSVHHGFAAALMASVGLALLAVLGVGIYAGIIAYVQGELHEMAMAAAGAAARSAYDDFNGQLVHSPTKAQAAGQEAFEAMKIANTPLTQFTPTLILQPLGTEVYEAVVLAQVNTPLLASIGFSAYLITARASAIYAQNNLSPVMNGLGNLHPQGGRQWITVPTDLPVFNGAGPDFYISTGVDSNPLGYHGIIVEVCDNGTNCYDVGEGAYPGNKGVIVRRNGKNVLYGEFYIDLEHTGIEKFNAIRIHDDGVNDRYLADDVGQNTKGARILELLPHSVKMLELRTMHHAFMCYENNCSRPTRFIAGGTPYIDSSQE
jgi:hypothetical protein